MFTEYCKGRIPVLIQGMYDFVDVRDVSLDTIAAGEKAPKELGYFPRHIARTMKDTIEWYEPIGKL